MPGQNAASFDPSDFPRTYRASSGWIALLMAFGVAAIVGGGCGTWYFGTGHEMPNATVAAIFALGSFAFVLLGAYMIADMLKTKVTLRADAIEFCNLRGVRRLRRDEISGYSVQPGSNLPKVIVLIPHRKDQKKLKLPMVMRIDAAFHAWMADIRNLDVEAIQKSEAEIAADPQLGATPAERLERLSRARKVVRALNIAALLVVGWGWFWPEPYALVVVVMAILPWLALVVVATAPRLYRLDEARNDAHPSVDVAYILPSIVLALRAYLDINIVEWQPVAAASVAGGFIFAAIAWLAERGRRRYWTTLILVPFGAAYAYGVVVLGDALLDRGPRMVYRTAVIDKYVASGKHKTLELRLAPWGPVKEAQTVVVSRRVYDAVRPGGFACIQLRPGALRIEWYVVGLCR